MLVRKVLERNQREEVRRVHPVNPQKQSENREKTNIAHEVGKPSWRPIAKGSKDPTMDPRGQDRG